MPYSYSATMTGDITVSYSTGDYLRCFLDPGGSDRSITPAAGFPSGFELAIINKGEELLYFDPAELMTAVGPGEKPRFYFNGASWA